MPRVSINKKNYAKEDFRRWMIGRMKEYGVRQIDFGERWGIAQPSVSYKIKYLIFSLDELMDIFEMLHADHEDIGRLLKI